jgi:prophage maintenance system killer protein
MKFWSKRTAAIMAVVYLLLLGNAITAPDLPLPEVLVVWAGSVVLTTAVAYVVKWLYVTARSTADKPDPEPDGAD